jgi:hypothetical protein
MFKHVENNTKYIYISSYELKDHEFSTLICNNNNVSECILVCDSKAKAGNKMHHIAIVLQSVIVGKLHIYQEVYYCRSEGKYANGKLLM